MEALRDHQHPPHARTARGMSPKKRRPRPNMTASISAGASEAPKDEAIFLRLSAELLTRLDAAAGRARERMPGMRITRSDIVRNFVERALKDDEEQARRGRG